MALAEQRVVEDEKRAPKRDWASIVFVEALFVFVMVAGCMGSKDQLRGFVLCGVVECSLIAQQASTMVRPLRGWFAFEVVKPGKQKAPLFETAFVE